MGVWLLQGAASPCKVCHRLLHPSTACCADVPVEDLLGDENLAALEAGQEGDDIMLGSLELNDPEAKPKKKGKSKAAAKGSPAKKPAKAGSAKASTDMQVRTTGTYTTQYNVSRRVFTASICIPQHA